MKIPLNFHYYHNNMIKMVTLNSKKIANDVFTSIQCFAHSLVKVILTRIDQHHTQT